MRRRFILLGLCAALVLTACGEQRLGRRQPGCGQDELNGTHLIAAQSVPGIAFAPCINDLKVGWSYEHLVAQSGQSRFWLNSDRVGFHFLEVTLEATCDVEGAVEVATDENVFDEITGERVAIPRYERVLQADFTLPITIVPEGTDDAGTLEYAGIIAFDLRGMALEGRTVEATIDDRDLPTEARIAEALAASRPVLVAGMRGQEQGTVELQMRAGSSAAVDVYRAVSLDEALEEIEGRHDQPRYRATWHYVFEGGCVTYEFDARGHTVSGVPADVEEALGFLPLTGAREWARQNGYEVP
jgi:hypothetical protein